MIRRANWSQSTSDVSVTYTNTSAAMVVQPEVGVIAGFLLEAAMSAFL